MLTKTTLTIMRARIAQLTHEVGVLRRENERLRERLHELRADDPVRVEPVQDDSHS
jgi:regulator of replication initiation timing